MCHGRHSNMNTKEIIQYVKNHPSQKVKIAFTDIDGILRGKYISVEKFLSVENDFSLKEGMLLNAYFYLKNLVAQMKLY